MWGKGVYFAASAAYSNSGYAFEAGSVRGQAGCKQLLLASVLVGDAARVPSDKSLLIPPVKPIAAAAATTSPSSPSVKHQFAVQRYDSVLGTTGGSDVYIIYETSGRAYPKYLVTYTC